MKPLKIYIAGPYSSDVNENLLLNTKNAIDVGIQIFRKGHFPYIPHLTHWVDMRAQETNITLEWNDYIKWDIPWLEVCDALIYLGKSKGADYELKIAMEMKKTIFYSIDQIPDV